MSDFQNFAWALLALAASLAPVALLALRDPKRLRTARSGGVAHGKSARGALAALALLPGVALIVLGDWPGWLVWAGALPFLGWLLVLGLSSRVNAKH